MRKKKEKEKRKFESRFNSCLLDIQKLTLIIAKDYNMEKKFFMKYR